MNSRGCETKSLNRISLTVVTALAISAVAASAASAAPDYKSSVTAPSATYLTSKLDSAPACSASRAPSA